MRKIFGTILAVFIIAGGGITPLLADGVSQEEYVRFLPLSYPKIFTQTNANKKFVLYGNTNDPTYQDVDPIDGIDDRRFEILQRINLSKFSTLIFPGTMRGAGRQSMRMNFPRGFPSTTKLSLKHMYIHLYMKSARIQIAPRDSNLFFSTGSFTPLMMEEIIMRVTGSTST